VIFRVLVDFADGLSLFDETKHVYCQHFLVGKLRGIVVALPLCNCGKPSSVAPTDEQVDPNKRRGSVHVAKGGLLGMLDASPFKPSAATWFFNP
jgi:hypothetical protein